MRRLKGNNKKLIINIILLLFVIGVGYAALASTLHINGTTGIGNPTWDIHFANVVPNSGNVVLSAGDQPAAITSGDPTEVTFGVTLKQPGDFYEFTVDAVNDGTIDGMIDTITSQMKIGNSALVNITPANLPAYLEYNVTYEDGLELEQKQLLKAGEFETYKVRVAFKQDVEPNQLPSTDQTLQFIFKVNYIQADETAIDRTPDLEEPTFVETSQGVVVITYPSGCTDPVSCSYTIDGNTTQATSPVTVMVGKDATIVATTSCNGVDVSSSYSVVRDILYVSSSGSDTNGFGTLSNPYQTLGKAYSGATSTKASTIYVMDNITQSSALNMDSTKDVTITSYEPNTSIKTITRESSYKSYLINNQSGTLRLQNITIDGNRNNVSATTAMIYVHGNTYMETGATLQNANNTNDFGGAFCVELGTLTINDGTITNNRTSSSGGSAIFVFGSYDSHSPGYVIINGGTISNNSSQAGTIWSAGEVTMNGGTITGNSANYGGGISDHGTFTMTAGSITNNTASLSGGGAYIAPYSGNHPVFTMTGGSITNNTASLSGGGTYYRSGVTYSVNGGTITGNSPNNEYRSIF